MSQLPRTFFTNFTSLGRQWHRRVIPEHIEKTKSTNFEFTVASYNVLADQLMKDNEFLYYTGMRKDRQAFDWNYRKHNLLKEIRHANADILCLQEVQEEHYYNWFSPRLRESGYSGTFKKRFGDKPDGCATFFKCDKFSVDSLHHVDYYRENVPLMDKYNVAIILYLDILNSKAKKKSTLCIANTHLLFNKNRGDIKLTQLAHLFADIEKKSRENDHDLNHLTMILCGDFNSVPFSPLYNFITSGELQYEGLKHHLVSGQRKKYPPKRATHFGRTLFPSSVGLSNTCRWIESEPPDASKEKCENYKLANNNRTTFNVETGQYEIMYTNSRDKSIAKRKPVYNADKQSQSSSADKCELQNATVVVDVESGSRAVYCKDSNKHTDHMNRSKIHNNRTNESKLLPNTACIDEPGFLRHGYSFKSAYAHYGLDGFPEITTCHDRDAATVDYIFYSSISDMQYKKKDRLILKGILSLFNEQELSRLNKLPNRYFSSDHMLIQASFILQQW